MSYISQHQGTVIDNAISEHSKLKQIILDTVYPIGSLYTSFNSTSPASIIGGTWEQIKDCFLMAAGNTYAAGTSGGVASHTHTSAAHTHTTAGHTLTIAEMPSHTHSMTLNDYSDNSYTGGFKWAYITSGYYKSEGSNYIRNEGGGGSHSHGNTGSTTPGNTGSSSNIPPYKTIYMWQRTA